MMGLKSVTNWRTSEQWEESLLDLASQIHADGWQWKEKPMKYSHYNISLIYCLPVNMYYKTQFHEKTTYGTCQKLAIVI